MVDRVKGVEKVTDNPFLNLYNFDVEKRNGKTGKYYVASRKKDPTQLKAATRYDRRKLRNNLWLL